MTDRERRTNSKERDAFELVLQERKYQRGRWSEKHDAALSLQDWLTILTYYQGRAAYSTIPNQENKAEFRKRVIQLAAVCLAALESTA